MENNELYHYGIPNMKWGNRRFQNYDGSLTPAGRERYGVGIRRSSSILNKMKARKQGKILAKKKQKARQELEAKKAYEKGREQAIKTGSAEEALRYKNDLSIEEKKAIYNRLLADNDLMKLAKAERDNAKEIAKGRSIGAKLEKLGDTLGKVGTTVDNFTKFYNSGAKIFNAFTDKPLPIIGEKKDKEFFSYSKKLADNLIKKSPDLSVDEMANELNRISLIETAEKYRSGNGKWVYRTNTANNQNANKAQQVPKTETKEPEKKKEENSAVGIKGMKWETKVPSNTGKTNWNIYADNDTPLSVISDRKKKKKR